MPTHAALVTEDLNDSDKPHLGRTPEQGLATTDGARSIVLRCRVCPGSGASVRAQWSGRTCRRLRRKMGKWMWMLAYGASYTTAAFSPQMGIGRDSGSDIDSQRRSLARSL